MGEGFVLTEHIADLTATHADVACRHIHIRADIVPQLTHEGLAETHDLTIRLAAWREVGATLGTTHRKRGEGVLEHLLEGKELQNTDVDGCVETQTAFVGANGVVVLHAVTHVCAHIALVVDPVNAELDDAVGDAQTLDEVDFLKLRMLVVLILDGSEHLAHCLDVLRLIGKLLLQFSYYFGCFHK